MSKDIGSSLAMYKCRLETGKEQKGKEERERGRGRRSKGVCVRKEEEENL